MWSASEGLIQYVRERPYRLSFSEDETRRIASLPVAERVHPAGIVLLDEEKAARANIFIVSGWAISYKTTASGLRAVTDVLQRGDFVGALNAAGRVHRSVQAKTDVTAFEIDAQRCSESSQLAGLVLRLLARSCCIADEHIAAVSRRSPLQRLAWMLLEIAYRYEQAGRGSGERFMLPITQVEIADALGVTPIHVNRLLRTLRERGWLRFRHSTVEILRRDDLVDMSGFDPGYLSFMSEESANSVP